LVLVYYVTLRTIPESFYKSKIISKKIQAAEKNMGRKNRNGSKESGGSKTSRRTSNFESQDLSLEAYVPPTPEIITPSGVGAIQPGIIKSVANGPRNKGGNIKESPRYVQAATGYGKRGSIRETTTRRKSSVANKNNANKLKELETEVEDLTTKNVKLENELNGFQEEFEFTMQSLGQEQEKLKEEQNKIKTTQRRILKRTPSSSRPSVVALREKGLVGSNRPLFESPQAPTSVSKPSRLPTIQEDMSSFKSTSSSSSSGSNSSVNTADSNDFKTNVKKRNSYDMDALLNELYLSNV